MDLLMDTKSMQELAKQLAKNLKTEDDLNEFTAELTKMAVEAALGAEMEEHLGYSKHAPEGRGSGNSRNGVTTKKLRGNHGTVEIDTPRDRNGTYEPLLVKKNQTRLTQMDDQILALYAKGMSTREIVDTFKEMYGADVSPTLVSRVTEQVMETLVEWQHRPLSSLYPILYLDCLVLKIRNDGRVINKSVYLALGVNLDGHKELLGLWLAENEGSKFWLSILTELKTRGVEDILIACVDGLKSFPEAINAEYPDTQVQLCIVHMVRNSLRYVSYKDYKNVTADLKTIYQAVSETEAAHALEQFAEKWDEQYPAISKIWRRHWDNAAVLFQYPPEIRKAIYTTNAIESLNSVIRKATKNHKAFPSDDSALKVVFMAINQAAKKWTMPIRDWKKALNRFIVEFGDRVERHL